jgi:hypothetical protein
MNTPLARVSLPRPIPGDTKKKYDAWKGWASVHNWVHLVVGGCSVALSTVVAANTSHDFLKSDSVPVAVAAAIASFVLTTLNPQKTAKGFVNAYRHLEKAIARFRFDPSAAEIDLGRAEAEAIDLLD